jgi:hypothetical protein
MLRTLRLHRVLINKRRTSRRAGEDVDASRLAGVRDELRRAEPVVVRIAARADGLGLREGTRYEKGSVQHLLRIRGKADSQRMILRVSLVQPDLSME